MSAIDNFGLAFTPRLHFGAGKISHLPMAVRTWGTDILLVTGAHSFRSSSYGQALVGQLRDAGIAIEEYQVVREPSPSVIDTAVSLLRERTPHCVVAIGGGSVLDAGKAISAMLPLQEPVKDYLEGVGSAAHPGTKVPFIAIPTTSGTGSEATKNAVISETGPQGYKRSLRHDNFVPNLAIVDPLLTLSCAASTTAASGMDTFTQLLESFVSTKANPITDALACEGLKRVARSLKKAFDTGTDLDARTDMALAAYLSGITLANAGLGIVHGFASPIGGYFGIPHGLTCSVLMAPANKVTVRNLRAKNTNPEALSKYAAAGKIFAGSQDNTEVYYTDLLLDTLQHLTEQLRIPTLSSLGVMAAEYETIVHATDNKNNPVHLSKDDMMEILALAG